MYRKGKHQNNKLSKSVLLFLIILLFILGTALCWASYLPFEFVLNKIQVFASDNKVNFFTHNYFEKLTVKLRLIGSLICFGSALLFMFRRKIILNLNDLFSSFSDFFQEISRQFIEAFKKEDKIHVFAFNIVLIIGIAVRLYYYLNRSLGYDEAWRFVDFASKPLFVIISHYATTVNHVFHTLLVHIIYLIFGNHLLLIRLPSLFAGILLIPASYLLIRNLYNKYAALLTAGIVSASAVFIEYSTYVNGHCIVVLFFLLIFSLAIYIKQNNNAAAWLIFSILSALGFYTAPYMLYPFGTVITWLFLSILINDINYNKKLFLRHFFLSLLVTVITTAFLYSPIILSIDPQYFSSNNPWLIPTSWSYFIETLPPFLKGIWLYWNTDIPFTVQFLLFAGFLASFIFHKRLSIHRVPVIAAVFVWLVPILSIQKPAINDNIWHFLLTLYIGLSSAGISYFIRLSEYKFSRYKSAAFSLLTVILIAGLSLNVMHENTNCLEMLPPQSLRNPEYIAIIIENNLKQGDKIILPHRWNRPVIYYFMVHDVPKQYYSPDLDTAARVLVLADKRDIAFENIAENEGLTKENYNNPNILFEGGDIRLYELIKK